MRPLNCDRVAPGEAGRSREEPEMPILHRRSEQSGHRHRIGKISQRLFGTTVTQKEVTTTTGPVLAGMKNIRFLRPQERLYCFLTTKTCVARINISNNNYSIRIITIQQQQQQQQGNDLDCGPAMGPMSESLPLVEATYTAAPSPWLLLLLRGCCPLGFRVSPLGFRV